MTILKFFVWFLWLLFMPFIWYASIEISEWWMVAFFLWFVPAHFIMRWLENGYFKGIMKEMKES